MHFRVAPVFSLHGDSYTEKKALKSFFVFMDFLMPLYLVLYINGGSSSHKSL